MDKLKLKLTTNFMRDVLASIVTKSIRKKCGYEVDVHINEVDLDMVDGKTHLHVDVDLDIGSDDFKQLLKSIVNK